MYTSSSGGGTSTGAQGNGNAYASTSYGVAFGFYSTGRVLRMILIWWLRSPDTSKAAFFQGVNSNGSAGIGNYANASNSWGVAFGFSSLGYAL